MNHTSVAPLITSTGTPKASEPRVGSPSLGELKARHREAHLCLRCTHHMVCGMAQRLDPNLLVTIASCLAFEPDAGTEANAAAALMPVDASFTP